MLHGDPTRLTGPPEHVDGAAVNAATLTRLFGDNPYDGFDGDQHPPDHQGRSERQLHAGPATFVGRCDAGEREALRVGARRFGSV
jgi:hypothetical protein